MLLVEIRFAAEETHNRNPARYVIVFLMAFSTRAGNIPVVHHNLGLSFLSAQHMLARRYLQASERHLLGIQRKDQMKENNYFIIKRHALDIPFSVMFFMSCSFQCK